MSCDGGLENAVCSRCWRMRCVVGEGWRMSRAHSYSHSRAHSPTFVTSSTSHLILQPFRRFTYATAHSPTLPSLHLHHNSLSNHSVTSPTSQLILQPFFCFSYVTSSSLNSSGEPPMDNIEEHFKEVGCDARNYIHLLKIDQCLTYAKAVMNLRVP